MTRRNPLAIKVAAAWSALSTSDRQTHTTAFIACLFLLLPDSEAKRNPVCTGLSWGHLRNCAHAVGQDASRGGLR
jgi:hypothetical protein